MSVLRRSVMRSPTVMFALLVTIALIILVLLQPANSIDLSSKHMLEDYDYLVDFLKDNYVGFDVFENRIQTDWLEHAAAERKSILPTTTPKQFYRLTIDLVATLDDDHAFIIPAHNWELIVKSANLAFNNVNFDNGIPNAYRPFFDDTINHKYAQWKSLIGIGSTRGGTRNPNPGVKTKVLEANRIAYIGIYSFWQTRVASEKNKLASFFERIAHYPYLIIDITENGGGSDRYWMDNIVRPLITDETVSQKYVLYRDSAFNRDLYDISELNNIAHLPSELNSGKYDFGKHFAFFSNLQTTLQPNDTAGFEGQIFVITSDRTASAANNFAMFAKHSGWATLAGGATQGSYGAGDAYVSLPNSGLVLRIGKGLVLNNDGSLNKVVGTQPDVVIDGEDKLERVIEYINRIEQQNHGSGT